MSVGQGAPDRAAVHGPFEWSTSRGNQVPLIQSSRGPRFVFSARCSQIAISSITPKFNPAIPCQIKPRPPWCWWWDGDFVAMIMMVVGGCVCLTLSPDLPHLTVCMCWQDSQPLCQEPSDLQSPSRLGPTLRSIMLNYHKSDWSWSLHFDAVEVAKESQGG